ncbi:hypothetical protein NONI108955_21150 [Nocardia ninae]|uniref:Uncharacterized protein n=1 Tax=Nocardia ninae NBRC 108245 TaxID=1210091 RepID=A0A511M9X3_9NOCA|nr:hypothetical protein [Nocardia ninae]GEM37462.1 hypothetical protein NN4_19810 [Nocardia ninae NBRC 108245]
MGDVVELRFRLAVARLADAIDQLASPRFLRVNDTFTARRPSLWDEMAEHPMLQHDNGIRRRSVAKSVPPLRLDVLDWLRSVEQQVGQWCGGEVSQDAVFGLGSPARWRPQDTAAIEAMATTVDGWVADAETLLNARRTFGIRGRCPECLVAQVFTRDDVGDRVRKDALQATDRPSCSCLACGQEWVGLDALHQLAAVS